VVSIPNQKAGNDFSCLLKLPYICYQMPLLTGSIAVVVLAGLAVPVSSIAALGTGSSLCYGTGHRVGMGASQNGNLGILVPLFMAASTLFMLDTGFAAGGLLISYPLIIVGNRSGSATNIAFCIASVVVSVGYRSYITTYITSSIASVIVNVSGIIDNFFLLIVAELTNI
jgi:hypothetical protein